MMNRRNDPYRDIKVYHRFAGFSARGVLALCYKRPRAINLRRGYSWTLRDEAVTCKKCLRLLAAREMEAA